MNRIKIIKSKTDYNQALEMLSSLFEQDVAKGSVEEDKVSLLAHLIEAYEIKEFPIDDPDPIEAIKFKMDQLDLKPKDLVPYIGSTSKVSEVLAGKRPLSISMVRALESGLNIPAKILIQEPETEANFQWKNFPIKLMEKRNYIKLLQGIDPSDAISEFISTAFGEKPAHAMLRKTEYIRSGRTTNKYSLMAWSAAVVNKARAEGDIPKFSSSNINLQLFKDIVKLSEKKEGPLMAKDMLNKLGVYLIIEPHLPKTYLDGAFIFVDKFNPVIALTLRHDRVDNFWFTLLHELSHLFLHVSKEMSFYDDFDYADKNTEETEADDLAKETLVPESKWVNSPAHIIPSPVAAESLAKELGIHPAIVAGKMRYEKQRFHYLSDIIKSSKVRQFFPEISW